MLCCLFNFLRANSRASTLCTRIDFQPSTLFLRPTASPTHPPLPPPHHNGDETHSMLFVSPFSLPHPLNINFLPSLSSFLLPPPGRTASRRPHADSRPNHHHWGSVATSGGGRGWSACLPSSPGCDQGGKNGTQEVHIRCNFDTSTKETRIGVREAMQGRGRQRTHLLRTIPSSGPLTSSTHLQPTDRSSFVRSFVISATATHSRFGQSSSFYLRPDTSLWGRRWVVGWWCFAGAALYLHIHTD